ncbi:hypothetical protein, partial [Ethanoligenens sp.]|uniref:hypothetical protein n=1 Tax=Ethanoligenens sp. TaxID=2099655 RepID=UPI0039E7F383
MLSLKKAYLIMFKTLEDYYNTSKNDNLGALLGALDPSLFTGDIPADQAAWDTWIKCVDSVNHTEKLDEQNTKEAIILFLTKYQNSYGFHLEEVIENLENSK